MQIDLDCQPTLEKKEKYNSVEILVCITETSPYSFRNFRKLWLYICFMPI